MELSDSRKHGLMFLAAFVTAGIVISTLVFPFWNLIREDVYEDVEILNNDNGVCYVETADLVPKTIDNDLDATDYTFGFNTAITIVITFN
mgnify:CR=1 FL=1